MSTEPSDPFDADLQELFVGMIPAAGFEDRLVNAVRSRRRMQLTTAPTARRAAIAAAAVLAVGTVGYYGNRAITGKPMFARVIDDQKSSSNLHQIGQAILIDPKWDFGGGSNSAQNWADWKRGDKNAASSYANPFMDRNPKDGWQLKDARSTFAAASDVNPGAAKQHDQSGQKPFSSISDELSGKEPLQHSGSAGSSYIVGSNGLANFADDRTGSGGDDIRKNLVTGNVSGLNYFQNSTVADEREKRGRGPFSSFASSTEIASPKLKHLDDFVFNSVIRDAIAKAPDDETEKRGRGPFSAPTSQPADDRKIIRTGSMEFEVDRFDAAQMQISKIVGELGGFVGATDSQKLPNGKVRGSISVRVSPERLDTLVLSLRALGDLKSQQISAADITKEYTDLESELAADRAMQDRLLELINGGKGSIKDLLAAENELGTWRGKIEKAEGMIRYYNGQVALSTLTIGLTERDIQTPATAVETETADVGIEADDVEKARSSALKAIDDAKGRVVEAELKRYDAGQLEARLVADVPPESAGAVIDQLKLLGKVARLEIHRQQSSSDGTNAVTADTPLRTERKPTRLLISIYNLANVAPRRTTSVSLAAADVESAYAALIAAAKSSGGRVVASNLDRGDPVKATGSLTLEFPPEKFESAMIALRGQGEVLKLMLTENPDTQNSTEAKQGLTVQLVSLASVPARESVQQTVAAGDVPAAYRAVLSAINLAHARVESAQLNEQDRQNITADVLVELPRISAMDFDKALAAAGGTTARTSSQAAEMQGTVDSKVSLHLSIISSDHLPPRETTRLRMEVVDVDKSAGDIQAAALGAGGRVIEATVTKDHGRGSARLVLDLPLEKSGAVLQQVRNQGTVRGIDSSRDPQAPAGALAHGQLLVEFDTPDAIVADQSGPWTSVRQGLTTSVSGLLWSLQWVIVGLCLIGPWAGLAWVGWKVRGKFRSPKTE